jgi:hypothetical protein
MWYTHHHTGAPFVACACIDNACVLLLNDDDKHDERTVNNGVSDPGVVCNGVNSEHLLCEFTLVVVHLAL